MYGHLTSVSPSAHRQPHTHLNRTWPGQYNFPDTAAFRDLGTRLDGGLAAMISPFSPAYTKLALMHNIRIIKVWKAKHRQ